MVALFPVLESCSEQEEDPVFLPFVSLRLTGIALLQALFAHLLKPLLRLYADGTEKVRELSIDLVTK